MVATRGNAVSAAEDADPACKRTSYEQIYLEEGRQVSAGNQLLLIK